MKKRSSIKTDYSDVVGISSPVPEKFDMIKAAILLSKNMIDMKKKMEFMQQDMTMMRE